MGHSVIQCPKCGAWIMEGHNNWDCDTRGCGYKYPETKKTKATPIGGGTE